MIWLGIALMVLGSVTIGYGYWLGHHNYTERSDVMYIGLGTLILIIILLILIF